MSIHKQNRNPADSQVSVTLTRKQITALDQLICQIRDSGGRKLPLNAVLRAAIRLFIELRVDPAGCHTEDELFAALSKAVKERR